MEKLRHCQVIYVLVAAARKQPVYCCYICVSSISVSVYSLRLKYLNRVLIRADIELLINLSLIVTSLKEGYAKYYDLRVCLYE